MEKRKSRKIIGLLMIILGMALFLISSLNITGFVIAMNIFSGFWYSSLGLILIILGIIFEFSDMVFYAQRENKLRDRLGNRYDSLSDEQKIAMNKSYRRHLEKRERDYEQGPNRDNYEIIETDRFKKAVRKHDPEEIQRAIEKIGTGLAHEERLKYKGGWSIKTSKGGRIIYDRDEQKRTAVLRDYTPNHKYERVN